MEIKKLCKIVIIFFISLNAHADIVGEYERITDNEECPSGSIMVREGTKNKRVLVFGSTHSWNLNSSNDSKTVEVVDEGCTYELIYTLNKGQFSAKTRRFKCPQKSENAVIIEKLELKDKTLTYRFGEESSKIEMQMCKYKKIK